MTLAIYIPFAFTALAALYWLLTAIATAYDVHLRSVPGPALAKFTNLWRLDLVRSGRAPESYHSLHAAFGSIVRIGPRVVSISDPTMIPVIYGIDSKYLKSEFYSVFATEHQGTTMDSMFSTRDPQFHRYIKRPVASKFSLSSVKTLEPLVDECSQIFHDSMLDLEGKVVDFSTWIQWYAFDVIGMITFHRRFGFMEERKDMHQIIEGIEFGLWSAALVGQLPWLHPYLLGNKGLMKLLKTIAPDLPDPIDKVNKITRECIEEYDERASRDLNSKYEEEDFLTFLRKEDQRNGTKMPDRDIMNHLTNNLLAGSDTTAISLRAVFYYIMQDQTVYQRVQRELDDADQAGKLSRFVTFAESLDLRYLQLCIKEALRLHPGVGFPLERLVPAEGAQIGDRFLPGGTIVGINAAVIHRNKNIFGEDADKFRPERWSSDVAPGQLLEMERSLLTFGAGARTCIGKHISILEMGKFVSQVLRDFDVHFASGTPSWRVQTFWFSRQSDFNVKFSSRRSKM